MTIIKYSPYLTANQIDYIINELRKHSTKQGNNIIKILMDSPKALKEDK